MVDFQWINFWRLRVGVNVSVVVTINYDNMDIWNVSNKIYTSLLLWRNHNGTFSVTKDEDYAEILNNGNYILMAKKFATLLGQLPGQVTFKAAKIIDYQLATDLENYIEIEIKNLIEPSLVDTPDSQGYKIWKFGSNIFVSGDLKIELAKISSALYFSRGFSQFGA